VLFGQPAEQFPEIRVRATSEFGFSSAFYAGANGKPQSAVSIMNLRYAGVLWPVLLRVFSKKSPIAVPNGPCQDLHIGGLNER
jgi:hypothetical protein